MTDRSSEESWDQRYRERQALWGDGPNRFLVEYAGGLTPGTALDLASGQGRNAIWLAENGHTVTAVELSGVATAQASQIAHDRGVDLELIHHDVFTWDPGDRHFDLVLLAYVQLPEDLRRQVHDLAMRVLSPAGRVLVIAHHRDNLTRGVGGPPMLEVLFTEEQLRSDFAGLEIEALDKVLRPVDLEDGSTANAIDVVLLARTV
ncbi:MAG: class I SAM-dependent methyltransferase [Acidimicrobiia bacterium]|nr:class I SAM-dependent methyltransferase [Acidimicrobiia bacterium]